MSALNWTPNLTIEMSYATTFHCNRVAATRVENKQFFIQFIEDNSWPLAWRRTCGFDRLRDTNLSF